MTDELELRFARLVEHHVRRDAMPSVEEFAADRPDLLAPLRALAAQYLAVTSALDFGTDAEAPAAPEAHGALPSFAGFRTIQRLGAGGMGEVYKLQDLKLDRFVAGKVVRADRFGTSLADFLGEARSLALFKDRRIVQIFEFRADASPPVIIMEYVDGFELGRVGPSLEFSQRARIVRDVCEAMHYAHGLGIQHRDLKPSNIMVDGSLAPRILDFGLSAGDPSKGHLKGTLAYIAPEQLDPSQPIDARSDVYALGVILYELLCGVTPFMGRDTNEVVLAIREAPVRLPIEVEQRVPEPLQAIALKAMERRPADRYASAREMSLDLTRYLEGRPVLARPTQYASTLDARVRPHLNQIGEWVRLRLIYPHEADRLHSAYGGLAAREDDWIASSRALSYSQIALYFGAFLLLAGSLFYFGADRIFNNVKGLSGPLLVLAVPFAGLNIAGRYLYRTERRAVAVAFFLAGVSLLPLFLLIWFHEAGILVAAANDSRQLFEDGSVSNRQLQVTILIACLWSGWLALRTRTVALSTVFTFLAFLLTMAVLGDAGEGLVFWIDKQQFDRIALHLWPLAAAYAGLGLALERTERPWLVKPLYVAAAIVVVGVLDLLAIDGKTLWYLGGISLQPFQPKNVSSDTLIDTVTTLSLNGMAFYALGSLISRRDLMKVSAGLLFLIAPFSTLEPIAWLVHTKEYALRFDWLYLALAVTTAVISHHRQRKSFYYAGLINSGFALYWVADHRHWLERPGWAITLVIVGLAALAGGFVLDARERRRNLS